MTAFIPPSELGSVPSDEEIWEGDDGDARFKVTRHVLAIPVKREVEVLSLSVSGEPVDRQRIIGEFNEVFGAPASMDMSDESHYVDVLMWVISE